MAVRYKIRQGAWHFAMSECSSEIVSTYQEMPELLLASVVLLGVFVSAARRGRSRKE